MGHHRLMSEGRPLEQPGQTGRAGRPEPPPQQPAGIVLTPGAGSGSDHPNLLAVEFALAKHGVASLRIDFPYRLAGRRAPDRPAVLVDTVRNALRAFADELGVAPERLAVGGRSMGGRICSMAVADGMPAAALVLISYPLHPPGRPDRLRTEHFPSIGVPCLFVSGDRDAFGSKIEFEAEVAAIAGPVTHAWIAGGDHSLKQRDREVAETVESWLCEA